MMIVFRLILRPAVRHLTIVQGPQQEVEYVWMSFLNLVKQNDGRGDGAPFRSADRLPHTHVTGRRSTKRLMANFSMYSPMSMRIRDSSESNMNRARIFASCVLPTPVGPRK